MPILKLDHRGDLEKCRAMIDWLAQHGIPAGDTFSPAFIDTDAKVIYWSACVYSEGQQGEVIPETNVVRHDCVLGYRLGAFGLDSAALDQYARVTVLQETAMVSEPPAEIVAGA